MGDFVLYNAPQSTCSQRVRFTMHTKGLPFDEVRLDLFSGDQLKPDYLKINPNAVVPALVHEGRAVVDSAVIMEYLDELFPEPSLVPDDAFGRARMRAMLRFIDEVPAAAIRFPSYNLAFLPHFQAMSEEEFVALADSKPLRRDFLLSMGRTGFSEKEMESAMERLRRAVKRMDEAIAESGGPWMMGSRITLPDISIMPVIVRLDDIDLASMWDERPNISRWLDLIRAEPAFEPTYYHGSLLTEKYPHLARAKEQRLAS